MCRINEELKFVILVDVQSVQGILRVVGSPGGGRAYNSVFVTNTSYHVKQRGQLMIDASAIFSLL